MVHGDIVTCTNLGTLPCTVRLDQQRALGPLCQRFRLLLHEVTLLDGPPVAHVEARQVAKYVLPQHVAATQEELGGKQRLRRRRQQVHGGRCTVLQCLLQLLHPRARFVQTLGGADLRTGGHDTGAVLR